MHLEKADDEPGNFRQLGLHLPTAPCTPKSREACATVTPFLNQPHRLQLKLSRKLASIHTPPRVEQFRSVEGPVQGT